MLRNIQQICQRLCKEDVDLLHDFALLLRQTRREKAKPEVVEDFDFVDVQRLPQS